METCARCGQAAPYVYGGDGDCEACHRAGRADLERLQAAYAPARARAEAEAAEQRALRDRAARADALAAQVWRVEAVLDQVLREPQQTGHPAEEMQIARWQVVDEVRAALRGPTVAAAPDDYDDPRR